MACGVGVVVSEKEITDAVNRVVNAHRSELLEQRYSYPISRLMYSLREGNMKWADGRKVKSALDTAILALLGEKTEADESVFMFPRLVMSRTAGALRRRRRNSH